MRYLTSDPIEPSRIIQWLSDTGIQSGAVVTFFGVVRADQEADRQTAALFYEAYEAMAEKELAHLVALTSHRWPVTCVVVQHRIGRVQTGAIALLVVVAAPHRAEAYAASQFLIDRIKQDAPIWKRACYTDGSQAWGRCAESSPDRVTPLSEVNYAHV